MREGTVQLPLLELPLVDGSDSARPEARTAFDRALLTDRNRAAGIVSGSLSNPALGWAADRDRR